MIMSIDTGLFLHRFETESILIWRKSVNFASIPSSRPIGKLFNLIYMIQTEIAGWWCEWIFSYRPFIRADQNSQDTAEHKNFAKLIFSSMDDEMVIVRFLLFFLLAAKYRKYDWIKEGAGQRWSECEISSHPGYFRGVFGSPRRRLFFLYNKISENRNRLRFFHSIFFLLCCQGWKFIFRTPWVSECSLPLKCGHSSYKNGRHRNDR